MESMDSELDVLKSGLNPNTNTVQDMQDILDKTSEAFSYETWEAIMDRLFAKTKQIKEKSKSTEESLEIKNSSAISSDARGPENHKIINYNDFESSEIDWKFNNMDLEDIRTPDNNDQIQLDLTPYDPTSTERLAQKEDDDGLEYGSMQYELFKTLESLYKMGAYNFGLK